MDTPELTNIPHIKFEPRAHLRTPSQSPSRSPSRQRITDDILSDLSPATTLEAFTSDSPSGKLRASVEAATPSERAFGIRATLASKKIQEWVDELSAWPWPKGAGAGGFELPVAKKVKLDRDSHKSRVEIPDMGIEDEAGVAYMGSLPAQDFFAYERRIDEIHDDMEDLDVEGIKTYVLNTHFSPRSRPSSSASEVAPMPSSLLSYTKMDDFTAIVTATVLQALPCLNRLTRLMDVWSTRLSVLRKVPSLLEKLADAENALKSGWQAIQVQTRAEDGHEEFLDRITFETMRDVLQDIVTNLGQDLDFMLDTLEGREDTLPDHWLDRMERIESQYGEWAVSADGKVREGEWAKMTKRKEEEEKRMKSEEAARDAAWRDATKLKIAEEERMNADQAATEAAKQEAENLRKEEADRLKVQADSEEATRLDQQRREDTEARFIVDEAAKIQAEMTRNEEEEMLRLRSEAEAEADVLKPQAAQTRQDAEGDAVIDLDSLVEVTSPQNGSAEIMLLNNNQQVDDKNPPNAHVKQQRPPSPLAFSEPVLEEFICTGSDQDTPSQIRPHPTQSIPLVVATTTSTAPVGMKAPDSHATRVNEDTRLSPAPVPRLASFDGNEDRRAELSKEENGLFSRDKGLAHLHTEKNDTEANNARIAPSARAPSPQVKVGNSIKKQKPTVDSIAFVEKSLGNLSRPSLPAQDPALTESEDVSAIPEPRSMTEASLAQSYLKQHSQETDDLTMQASISDVADEEFATPASDRADYISSSEAQKSINEHPEAPKELHLNSIDPRNSGSGHSRNVSALSSVSAASAITGYSTSDPSPEIQEAEPAAYFRPVLSPIKSSPSLEEAGIPLSPIRTDSDLGHTIDALYSSTQVPEEMAKSNPKTEDVFTVRENDHSDLKIDGANESRVTLVDVLRLQDLSPAALAQRTTIDPLNMSIERIEVPRRGSNSSSGSTIITQHIGDATFSPIPSSPVSIADVSEPFPEVDEQSPTAGRIGYRDRESRNDSPPESPSIPGRANRRSSHLLDSSSVTPSSPLSTPMTPISDETPNFPSLDITPAPFSSPKKSVTTDDHFQAQISSLLENISAPIRLTSEAEMDSNLSPFSSSQNGSLRQKKTRRSLTPSVRSSSSMSGRAPTPSFTLAPAHGKSTPRTRHQNGNPEIKLYHLSRSTGETPIKLFVRLVGENGERVMVRVGGGWADLGEYLREYASHHGRRVISGKNEDDKVEIQDLPSRVVSNTSMVNSGATIRGIPSGRSSPAPRPESVLERERPMSSLYIRKTRKSVGEQSETNTGKVNISPSTPLPSSPPRVSYDTPPSGHTRSTSRMSWTEDDGGLGLAGPKSKSKPISERDQEWVESMKEKVRLASAEKEKQQRKEGSRKSFGELEKVGGTKRLFKKG